MKKILSVAIFLLIMVAFTNCNDTKSLLIGQWEVVDSNIDKDLLSEKDEFLADGTGLSEASNLRGVGAYAESFTWRIDDEGRLVIMSPTGLAQIYSIAEISESTLILEGKLPKIGDVQIKYSKRKKGGKSALISVEPLKDYQKKKKYKTVKIGKQIWMAEYLNEIVEGSKCYENNLINCEKYGRLYSWKMAMSVCPDGWHLPTNEEWDELYRYVDGTSGTESPYKSETAGKYLKAKKGWNDNDGKSGNGKDKFGFATLPGGGDSNGGFYNAGGIGIWWSSSENDAATYASLRIMLYDSEYAGWDGNLKSLLFSVRCVQD
ncbi:MAG: hypothetical protein LBB36_05160 [Fibromonadaceae bacterium]|jgi:uncharacterized protein (TIGR02145 family)|nr:hypothetical protein [Fibromonadaceae bacterium]